MAKLPRERTGVQAAKSLTKTKGGSTRKQMIRGPRVQVLTGEDNVELWDDEEILRGRRRDRTGHFRGADPTIIPKEVHDELIRRAMRKSSRMLHTMQGDALEQLQSILMGADVEDKDRLKAIEMVLNRTMGKAPERVEISAVKAPWEDLMVTGVVSIEDDAIDTEGYEETE